MSKPIYVGANVSTTDTFSQWLSRTNQIIFDMGTTVVTTANVLQPNTTNGALTAGNAHVAGVFSANSLVATSSLRGGTVSTPANLVITSNTIFSQSALIAIQANTANFNVQANTTTVNGNFAMSNTAKTFTVHANSTTISHGPFTVSSNSAFTGAFVDVNGSNLTVTSNTSVSATTINMAGNVTITGVNTNIYSTNINLGDDATDTVFAFARFGRHIIPTGTTVDIGNTSLNFGNVHATNGVYSNDMTVGRDTTTQRNLFVNGTEARVQGFVNANALYSRSSVERGIFYNNTSLVETSSNFTYQNGRVSILGTNATFESFTTTGGGSFGGTLNVGNTANVAVDANIGQNANTNNLRVRSIPVNRIAYTDANSVMISTANLTYNGTLLAINTASDSTTAFTVRGSGSVTGNWNANGALTVGSTATIGANTTINGAEVRVTGFVNANALFARSAVNRGLFYSNAGSLETSANFIYNGGTLSVNGTTAAALGFTTTGSGSFGGSVDVAANTNIGVDANIAANANTNNLRVRSIPTNRIPYANATNFMVSSANLTYNGTLLAVTGASNVTSVFTATGSATVTGALTVGGATGVGGELAVSGNTNVQSNINISSGANTDTLRVRSLIANNGIAVTDGTTGNIVSSGNFTFNNQSLVVNGANSSSITIQTNGDLIAGGSGSFFRNLDVNGNTVINGDLTVNGRTFMAANSAFTIPADSTVSKITVTQEIEMANTARVAGNIMPRVNNLNDVGSETSIYRSVYANTFVGNISWNGVTDRPSPVLTFAGGDTTGNGAMTSLGGVSIALTTRSANSTASGVVNTAAQTFSGVKTFANTITGSINGNANTATRFQTARTINETSFDGSSNITIATRVVTANTNSNISAPMAFVNSDIAATSNGSIRDIAYDSRFTYHLETGSLRVIDVNSSSDARKKYNIKTIENSLNKVSRMRGVEYDRFDTDLHYVGVIAQEMEEIIPEVVNEDADGFKYVSYGNLVGVLIEAIKDLKNKVDVLEEKLKDR